MSWGKGGGLSVEYCWSCIYRVAAYWVLACSSVGSTNIIGVGVGVGERESEAPEECEESEGLEGLEEREDTSESLPTPPIYFFNWFLLKTHSLIYNLWSDIYC